MHMIRWVKRQRKYWAHSVGNLLHPALLRVHRTRWGGAISKKSVADKEAMGPHPAWLQFESVLSHTALPTPLKCTSTLYMEDAITTWCFCLHLWCTWWNVQPRVYKVFTPFPFSSASKRSETCGGCTSKMSKRCIAMQTKEGISIKKSETVWSTRLLQSKSGKCGGVPHQRCKKRIKWGGARLTSETVGAICECWWQNGFKVNDNETVWRPIFCTSYRFTHLMTLRPTSLSTI